MPTRPKRPCAHIGCKELVSSGYCEKHKPPPYQYQDKRESASKRGYDRRWQVFSRQFIANNPLCVECLRDNKYEPAVLVHHIIPLKQNGDKYDENNLMPLCFNCHEVVEKRKRRG